MDVALYCNVVLKGNRMKFIDMIYEVAKMSGMPTTKIGPAVGKNREYVSKIRSAGADPSTANAARMLEACGWKLVALPADKVPPEAMEISPTPTTDDEKAEALRRQAEQLRKQAEALLRKADGE
jgi:DNA-binding phage protein